jgi:hypothetical protein
MTRPISPRGFDPHCQQLRIEQRQARQPRFLHARGEMFRYQIYTFVCQARVHIASAIPGISQNYFMAASVSGKASNDPIAL